MSEHSPDSMVAGSRAFRGPAADHRMLVLVAWTATLLLSKLPLVIARDLMGTDIPWIVPAWIGTALLLCAATYAWQALRPLRGYFVIMTVILLVTGGIDPLVRNTPVWRSIFTGLSPLLVLLGERALVALQALVVVGCLLLFGVRRQDAYLTVGDLGAPIGGRDSPARKENATWLVIGPIATLVLAALFFAFLASQNPAGLSDLGAILSLLPLILLCAALNAFGEEAMYRAAPLAMLVPPIGPRQALWMISVWFGLGHYYGGIPSGPIGFVQSGLVALLLGKAMIDTRGMGWPWIIHLALDVVIYVFIALTTVM